MERDDKEENRKEDEEIVTEDKEEKKIESVRSIEMNFRHKMKLGDELAKEILNNFKTQQLKRIESTRQLVQKLLDKNDKNDKNKKNKEEKIKDKEELEVLDKELKKNKKRKKKKVKKQEKSEEKEKEKEKDEKYKYFIENASKTYPVIGDIMKRLETLKKS